MTDTAPVNLLPEGVIDDSRDRAVNSIAKLAEAASALTFHRMPGDPAHVGYLRNPDGSVEYVETTPAPRTLTLSRVSEIAALAQEHFDKDVQAHGRQAIFVHRDGVDLIFDTEHGRERASVPMPLSIEYRFFTARVSDPNVDVKAFRQALENELRMTFDDAKLVVQIGQLNTADTTTTQQASQRGRESISMALVAEVRQPGELPPPIYTFKVRMWAHADGAVRFPIECGLEPDPGTKRWLVRPYEDSRVAFEAAQIDAVASTIRYSLGKAKVPVYLGTYKQP